MSFARLVRFSCTPGDSRPAQAVADDLTPLIKEQPGCEFVVVFGDDSGEAGLFVVWDSQEDANAAAAIIRPKLDQLLSGHVTAPPETGLFPILST